MNRANKSSFDRIIGASTAFVEAVRAVFEQYRTQEAEARRESAAFKDEQGIYTAKMAAIRANTRNALKAAENGFTGTITAEIGTLRQEIDAHLLNRPTPAFLETLRLFRDFGITPSRADIAALLTLNGGNTLGLRCLNAALKSTEAGYTVTFPDTADFEADIAALEKLARGEICYVPAEYHHEGTAIYGGSPRTFFREDGSTYQNGETWSSVSLSVARTGFESKIKSLDEMASRWTDSVIPSIEQLKDYADRADGTAAEQFLKDREATTTAAKIEPSGAESMTLAQKIGKAKADAAKLARVRQEYGR